jgi:S-adenosylmethionine hydrolase
MDKAFPLVYFFSDFGAFGPYTGQVEAVIRHKTHVHFINLLSDAPTANPFLSSYLLAAVYAQLPVKSGYLLAVVDPGVGSERRVISFTLGEMTFIGPDNGIFSRLIVSHHLSQVSLIDKPSGLLSDSFHARDWFAPVLAEMIEGRFTCKKYLAADQLTGNDWPRQITEIIYIDHYGNLVTGLPAGSLENDKKLEINGIEVGYARTFSQAAVGGLFWYRNSMGQIEVAANQASAAELLKARTGTVFELC